MRDYGKCNVPDAALHRVERYSALKKVVNPTGQRTRKSKYNNTKSTSYISYSTNASHLQKFDFSMY